MRMRMYVWHSLAGAGVSLALLLSLVACAQSTHLPPPRTTTPTPDPLIYGTNMALYDANDQMLHNDGTQQLLQRERVPIIRMPFRPTLSDATLVQALQVIKTIGAVPLVIIHGPTDPNAAADDRHALALVQQVFGSQTVYVEFGNESDLSGFDATAYTQAWNRVIPALKASVPTYRFVGPVTSSANAAYIAAFDAGAKPRPDANSWHEYACTPDDADTACMAHTSSWTDHVQAINRAVRAAIGATLPLMLTEWNLDASSDPRYASTSFMQTWTSLALRTLAANVPRGLLAATQYCVTNNEVLQLIDSENHLTPEGQAFFQAAQRAQ